jgi:dTDP-4-dehydrorhamnose reductase
LDNKLKIAVLGSTGMAGSMMLSYFTNRGHYTMGFARSINTRYMSKLFNAHSMEHLDNLVSFVMEWKPDAIINCIGYLVQDSEKNPAEAIYINSYFPHLLENMTKGTGTKVIHISTDCIFSGTDATEYVESSFPTETNYYGRSKALGELKNSKDLTLRQSIIGPAPQASNTGLFNWILRETSLEVGGWSRMLWNGITTLELAKQIEAILLVSPQLHGIVNLTSPEVTNKYDLIKMIIDEWYLPLQVKNVLQPFFICKVLKTERDDVPLIKSDYRKQLKELHEYMIKHNITVGNVK